MKDESILNRIKKLLHKNTTCMNKEWVILEGCTAHPSCAIQFLVRMRPLVFI